MVIDGGRVPLYEYECRKCSRVFEELVFGSTVPSCPGCGGEDLERLMSVVSGRVSEGAEVSAQRACGSCGDPRGPGACRN
jgi:putative FmdB family regulatory protein